MTTHPLPAPHSPVPTSASIPSPARLGSTTWRWAPLSGFAFAVFFVVSIVASNVPADGASDRTWLAAFSQGHAAGHMVTAYSLDLAGLSLVVFLTTLWTRVLHARGGVVPSPVPLLAAAVAGACMAAGGVSMGVVSIHALRGYPEIIRLGTDGGFAMVGVGAMLAASLSVACLSVMAHSTGVIGRRTSWFGLLVALVLLGAIAFLPIGALVLWVVVVAVVLLRHPEPGSL